MYSLIAFINPTPENHQAPEQNLVGLTVSGTIYKNWTERTVGSVCMSGEKILKGTFRLDYKPLKRFCLVSHEL
jgi:hypothetical protein